MKLDTLMTTLCFGSLGNLPIFGEGTGTPQDQAFTRVIVAANQAMTEFYTRFAIRSRTLVVEAIDGRSSYPLDPMYAVNSGIPGSPKYILDNVDDPWLTMDILWVTRVIDDCGTELWVNASATARKTNEHLGRVFFPEVNLMMLADPKQGDQYMVEYRGAPALVDPAAVGTDWDAVEFSLPSVYEPAFVEKVSGLIYRSLNGQENTAKGAELVMSSEVGSRKLEEQNVDNKETATYNERFHIGGWV